MKNQFDINHQFGARIRYLRKKANRSIEDFSFDAGLNKNYLGDLERGTRNPTLKIINKIAKGFNMKVDELLKGVSDE